MSSPPFKVSVMNGLTKGLLQGFDRYSKLNKKAGISFTEFSKMFKYRPKGYQFSPKFGHGWDGYISLLYWSKTLRGYTFPCGLTHRVLEYFKTKHIPVDLSYSYTVPEINEVPTELIPYKLRKYQVKSAKIAIKKQRGIIKSATGSGKTEIGAAIIKAIGQQTIWLTHKKDLLYQTQERMKEVIGIECGILGDGKRDISKMVTIASVKTILLHMDELRPWLNKNVLLIGDEIHKSSSREWQKVMKSIPGVWRLGLTATTPDRDLDKLMELEAVTGPVIVNISSKILVEHNYLSEPYIFYINTPEVNISTEATYLEAYTKGITENKKRNKAISKIAIECCSIPKAKPVVIICKHLKHIRNIHNLLKNTKYVVKIASGSASGTKRKHLFKEVEEGKIDILIASSIFDEGIDIKNLRTLIIAGSGRNYMRAIQQLGRALRKTETKSRVIVIDFTDTSHSFLRKASRARKNTFKQEKHKVIDVKNKRELYTQIKKVLEE